MKRTCQRTWCLGVGSILLSSALVACGDGSGDAPADVPAFQGDVTAPGPGPEEGTPPSSEGEVEAPPADEPGGTSSETGVGGDLPLEPGAEGEPPAGDEVAPETPAEPEAPVVPEVFEPLPKFVGNITTGNSVDTNGLTFSEHWDQITPENAGKWGSVQRTAGAEFNWGPLDAIYDYAEQNGIIFKEHTFVWGSQQPTGNLTEADVRTWMSEFCARYPRTRLIDVVNEPPPHTEPSYADAIGGGTDGNWQWIVNSFMWAREYCPNAILILNDYNNIEIGNQNQHFIDIAQTVLAAGAPIDALGAQAHGLSGANSTANMITLLNRMHDQTGLPVYITEYDINQNDDAAQLDRFQQQVSFFLDTEWIHGITVWGWIFGRTWVASSGLIRDGAPRPAMVWLMEELGRPVPQ